MIQKTLNFLSNYYLNLIFYTALLATIGSLFLSNILLLPPCDLCWYQRIFMYPIAVLAGLALFYKEKATIAKYILALSIPGAIIALYHYAIQMNIIQSILPGCSFASPCTETQIMWLGFITIPLLSFGAFLVITLLVGNYLYRNRG